MRTKRMNKAKQALMLFLRSLPEDTYFNIVSFRTRIRTLYLNSVRYSSKEVSSPCVTIDQMRADMGGTNIYYPLMSLLTKKPIDRYSTQIFLLTDGAVFDTKTVINMVGQNNKFSRVPTIGIGNGCSQALILGAAEKGKDYHVYISDEEEPSAKIIQLLTDSLSPVISSMKDSLSPVISSMKLSYDKSVILSIIPNPESLPYILKDQLVNFYITFRGHLLDQTVVQFLYSDSLNKLPYKSELVIDPRAQSESFVDKMGHFKKIRLLQQSYLNNSNLQDMMYYVKLVDKKSEIIKESVKHQILSQFTGFICVETTLVDGKYHQIKDTRSIQVEIVNPKPIQKNESGGRERKMTKGMMRKVKCSCSDKKVILPFLRKC